MFLSPRFLVIKDVYMPVYSAFLYIRKREERCKPFGKNLLGLETEWVGEGEAWSALG